MKSHIPNLGLDFYNSSCKIEHINISYDDKIIIADAYLWLSPNEMTICTNIIIPCPKCEYPIVIKPDQVALTLEKGNISLSQKIACPSHWKKMEDGIVDVDAEGNPITLRCGWSCKGIHQSKIRS